MAENSNIEKLRRQIIEEYGDPCPDYHPGCFSCIVWREFGSLAKQCPELSDEQLDKALHWLDRYSAGIDGFPQFDRISNARAVLQEQS